MKNKIIPFWAWNEELDEKELIKQIDWMHSNGIGGFFMHARGGLITPYLGEKWFSCVDTCIKYAKKLGMDAFAYDENGWPSGFVGGKLLEEEENRDCYLTYDFGEYNPNSFVSYDISGDKLIRVSKGNNVLNVYCHRSEATADILNKEVVKKFITLTHEEYKKRDTQHLIKGFFTDEPQYQRWYHPYTHCLEEYFKSEYGQDIKDRLGLMFVEKEGFRDFRYKYWKSMQSLMLNSFAKQVYEWCDQNNYLMTGHYIEDSLTIQMMCCAGAMPFYEYEHIPGVDWLTRYYGNYDISLRQVGSVCAQLGKKDILSESFACAGWDATPAELKQIFEYQAISGGISILCHHLLPYKEYGQRKRDYPEHYSRVNPWVDKNFKKFNEEINRIGERISSSSEIVNVALLHPIRSAYLNYKRDNPIETTKEFEDDMVSTLSRLNRNHISFHFIDETILSKYGKVSKDSIIVGKCSYSILIIPKIYTMDKYTESIIHQYINNGGKVILLDKKPQYLEGDEYNYDYLESNITFDEIIKQKPFISTENKDVRISYRIDDLTGEKFFYILNIGEDTSIKLNGCSLNLKKYDSRFINEKDLIDDKDDNLQLVKLGKEFKLNKKAKNFFTIDKAKYSFDGKTYSSLTDCMGIQDFLLNKRYQGDLYLKYEFNIKDLPKNCSSLIEDQHILQVTVNGKIVEKKQSVLEEKLWEFDIADKLKLGENEIVVKINYFQNENVYYALFGQTAFSESLINSLAYPTTIEAIYLMGDFAVYGDFHQGKKDNVLIGNNFYLGKQKETISSLIKDGFPFLRGDIELEQEINLKSNKCKLELPNRYAMIDLYVNDKHVKEMIFDREIDISKYAKTGLNKIKIILTVSNRNLLGPHHLKEEETFELYPSTFERMGLWGNPKADDYIEDYAFIKN